ncbi:beta-lactamase/transpeptidase-like protein, partial [Aureobasidium melanogenum]
MKKSLAQVMQEYVFTPLGMKRSTYAIPDDEDLNTEKQQGKGNYARAYYNGYTACEAPHRVNPEQSAAGLWTTPTDLLILVYAIQKSLHDENEFLPHHLANQMLEEVTAGMAHGWFVTNTHFGHSGSNMPGWRCNVMASLDGNQAFCFMTNSLEGYLVGQKVQAAMFYLLGWKKPKEFAFMKSCVVPFADVSAAPPDTVVMEKWTGTWKEQGTQFRMEFMAKEGVPWLKIGQMPEQWLWIASHVVLGKNLLDLSTELLLMIFDATDKLSLVYLRLTCGKLHDVTNEAFGAAFFVTRHIIFSKVSVDTLLEITEHPIFGRHVKEIVFASDFLQGSLSDIHERALYLNAFP